MTEFQNCAVSFVVLNVFHWDGYKWLSSFPLFDSMIGNVEPSLSLQLGLAICSRHHQCFHTAQLTPKACLLHTFFHSNLVTNTCHLESTVCLEIVISVSRQQGITKLIYLFLKRDQLNQSTTLARAFYIIDRVFLWPQTMWLFILTASSLRSDMSIKLVRVSVMFSKHQYIDQKLVEHISPSKPDLHK